MVFLSWEFLWFGISSSLKWTMLRADSWFLPALYSSFTSCCQSNLLSLCLKNNTLNKVLLWATKKTLLVTLKFYFYLNIYVQICILEQIVGAVNAYLYFCHKWQKINRTTVTQSEASLPAMWWTVLYSDTNRPLALLRGHVTNVSFKQWVGILLYAKNWQSTL